MLQRSHRAAVGRAVGPALAVALAAACGSHPASPPAPPTPAPAPTFRSECLIEGDSTGSGDPMPLVARTADDTAMVRSQWAVPPIRLDCTGKPSPGSAQAWSADSSGRHWTLVLAQSAPDAAAVVSGWRDSSNAAALRLAGVRWLIPLDIRRIVVELDQPSAEVPMILADPALAVPVDSGGPALSLAAATADPRDALERGGALVRTTNPDLVAYARGKSAFRVVALPWSRTYALVLPPGAALALAAASDSAAFRAGLASDVVPGEARPPEPPFWWQDPPSCGTAPAAATVPLRTGPLLYPEGDPIAAALAARLVALSDESGLTVRALPAAAIDSALAHDARGAVIGLPKRALVPCRELGRWPAGSRIVALVESRQSAIVRRGIAPLAVEYDGTLRPAQVR